MSAPNFGIYYLSDAYSTQNKIMGRQSAGKSLLKGVARRWKSDIVNGYGDSRNALETMFKQLQGDGFQGKIRWFDSLATKPPNGMNALYYPSIPIDSLAQQRNSLGPASYSLFGVTHTLSSGAAMDQLARLLLRPFQPWDGLICTSTAALGVVDYLHEEAREWWASSIGATRFNPIAKTIIPLGVNAPDFVAPAGRREQFRQRLNIVEEEVCFLFAGRMSFHAKANPVTFYQALEAACKRLNKPLVCIEAGGYPNDIIAGAFQTARIELAPSARFINVDGQDEAAYNGAWAAADVFVSLSDNIQETFGITPVEAMAAGLPVIVSDWNGYKDTVRDGVGGFRIPVILPSVCSGEHLASRHDLGTDSYDRYIGRVSMMTVLDGPLLVERIIDLAQNADLRHSMGQAGRRRVATTFDWPIILDQYTQFAAELEAIRTTLGSQGQLAKRLSRPDPFALFAHYPTHTLAGDMKVALNPTLKGRAEALLDLTIGGYVIDPAILPKEAVLDLLSAVEDDMSVAALLATCPQYTPTTKTSALMWLAKMGLLLFVPGRV
jgi:glycosyltransferase involved in cell wall biosynthesis